MTTLSVDVASSTDVVRARQMAADLAQTLGFGAIDQTRIATAVSEIARNVLQHSGTTGTVELRELREVARLGLSVVVSDRGIGIADIGAAMQDGYSTSVASLGAGLPGARRLMDSFAIESKPNAGTVVRMVKWLKRPRAAGG